MSGRGNKPVKKSPEKLYPELTIREHLNAEKMLIIKLKKREKAYESFLIQIDNFIEYAREQANNNDNSLKSKYLDVIKEEESLRDKIIEYLKKNNELIESLKKSNFNREVR